MLITPQLPRLSFPYILLPNSNMLHRMQELIPEHNLQYELPKEINRDQERQINLPPFSNQLNDPSLILNVMEFIVIDIQLDITIVHTCLSANGFIIELQFHFFSDTKILPVCLSLNSKVLSKSKNSLKYAYAL